MHSRLSRIVGSLTIIVLAIVVLDISGCGGGTSTPAPNTGSGATPSVNTGSNPPLVVTVAPSSITVQAGTVQQFSATITPAGANQAVSWAVAGTGCSGASCGTIDGSGKYTAPSALPNPSTVTVTATAVSDPSRTGTASVAIASSAKPSLSANPASIAFGAEPVNTTSTSKAVTLSNTGSTAETFAGARINGLNFADFAETNNCPSILAAGASCTFQVTFTPGAAGNRIGYLIIDGIQEEEANVSLAGSGVTGTSEEGCSPATPVGPPGSIAIASDLSGTFGKFAYVTNSVAHCISIFAIDATSGRLTPVDTIGGICCVSVHPSGEFAYARGLSPGGASCDICIYRIDGTTGLLTFSGAVSGATFDGGLTITPSGKFAYINSSQGIIGFAIDPVDGSMTPVGSPAPALGVFFLSSMMVDPSSKFLYVAEVTDTVGVANGNVSMYAIGRDGSLASLGTIDTGIDPLSVAIHPSGKFAYVANVESGDIWIYSIDAATGTLSLAETIGVTGAPEEIAFAPSGNFAYVVNQSPGSVSIFSVDAVTGALTLTGTVAEGTAPISIAIDPSGKFAYVANYFSDNISMYSIDAATGALTLIGTVGV